MRLHGLKLCWPTIWVHTNDILDKEQFLLLRSMKSRKRSPNLLIYYYSALSRLWPHLALSSEVTAASNFGSNLLIPTWTKGRLYFFEIQKCIFLDPSNSQVHKAEIFTYLGHIDIPWSRRCCGRTNEKLWLLTIDAITINNHWNSFNESFILSFLPSAKVQTYCDSQCLLHR